MKDNIANNRVFAMLLAMLVAMPSALLGGERFNFNAGWRLCVGVSDSNQAPETDDSGWQRVTLPHAWNQSEAFSRVCAQLSDTIVWYRKHFSMPKEWSGKRIFVEFEGVRFGAQAFLNGKELGWSDNGIMAFGFDLTPYVNYEGDNVLAVMVDNSWRYHEHQEVWSEEEQKMVRSGFQWNDRNFYCNYGGINKNVWLHVTGDIYQTLPLYSNLGTTGVYVYGKDYDIHGREATIHAESQVINASDKGATATYRVNISDKDGRCIATFDGKEQRIAAGDTATLQAEQRISDLHFWSWGYGYLYDVETSVIVDGKTVDKTSTRTGFRKTEFKDGMIYLNDRVIMMKGFAQRSTNEWPALGIDIPAWMSDYSNRLVLECNGNMFRWMHVTPSKQDVRSLDRLGLIQAMPAGDAEKDVNGRRWQQRLEVMRDAIIYNRNSPSIFFYECGNNDISEEHMAQMKLIRDQYDSNGDRAIGCRNMLDSQVAEYGGEMLYVNKSASKPMWMMEFNRDEGIRRYWDQWSYPYHKEGEGPLYRGEYTASYNHNQDGLAIENIVRWNEYWLARPGTGTRVNSGGAKIIFSDSNTHARGEKNYRTSGDVDPMRIPKDSYYAHQAMWDGWVDTEREHTYIIGHWNYDNDVAKPVYVVSTGDEVELYVNGQSQGKGERSSTFLYTFDNVQWHPGTLAAISRKDGHDVSWHEICTVDEPVRLRMHWVDNDKPMRADGSDIRIAEIEAVDKNGRRHPLAHDVIRFDVTGAAEYIGGCSGVVSDEERELNASALERLGPVRQSEDFPSPDTNGILSKELMLEAGVTRVMVRSTLDAGEITLTATPTTRDGEISPLKAETLSISNVDCHVQNGFYTRNGKPIEADWAAEQALYLERGETPAGEPLTVKYSTVPVSRFEAAANAELLPCLTDDNEKTAWQSDSRLENSWLRAHFDNPVAISMITARFKDFRQVHYPLQVFADDQLVWEGYAGKCLGDSYIFIDKPIEAHTYTIKMVGPANMKDAFASMSELADRDKASAKESKSNTLSIIEISFNKQ